MLTDSNVGPVDALLTGFFCDGHDGEYTWDVRRQKGVGGGGKKARRGTAELPQSIEGEQHKSANV